MPITRNRPDSRAVEDFLLGRLSDAEAEVVAACLETDPAWQTLLPQAVSVDPLVETVRAAATVEPTEAPPDLINRLEELRATLSGVATTAGPDDTVPPASAAVDLSFLRPAEHSDELGRLGGFRVVRLLGSGGMGLVFEAEDLTLGRRIALKVIRPERAADAVHRDRFLREARAAAALRHDHVIPIYQVGEDAGVAFLAMPLLAGESLDSRLRREKQLPIPDVLRLGREIAEGLAAAHAAGLIHRDIKPANIWLEARCEGPGAREEEGPGISNELHAPRHSSLTPRIQILDFGLARAVADDSGMTQTGMVVGTPAYMSPEQADGKPLDARSDLFSLGSVLYRMATGDSPFHGPTLTATLRAVSEHHPPPPCQVNPDVPKALSDLIMHLLAKSPDMRPPTAQAVAATLAGIERGDAATVTYQIPGLRRRSRRWPVIAAAILMALLSLVLVQVFRRDSDSPRKDPDPIVETYRGHVDLLVWRGQNDGDRMIRLEEPGVMPLRVGDKIRIEAKVTPAAYLYVFWIDTEGNVEPVYPWKPRTSKQKEWKPRPKEEAPREELSLPPNVGKHYTISGDQQGMETLLLLARPTRLEADDEQVKTWFADLGPQRPIQDLGSVVWFENGKILTKEPRRRSVNFNEGELNDPALRLQALVQERLQPFAAFTTSLSFAKAGK